VLYYIPNRLFATSFSEYFLLCRFPSPPQPSEASVGGPGSRRQCQASIRKQAFGGLLGSLQFVGVVTSFRQCNSGEAIALHVPSYGAESTGVKTAQDYPNRSRLEDPSPRYRNCTGERVARCSGGEIPPSAKYNASRELTRTDRASEISLRSTAIPQYRTTSVTRHRSLDFLDTLLSVSLSSDK